MKRGLAVLLIVLLASTVVFAQEDEGFFWALYHKIFGKKIVPPKEPEPQNLSFDDFPNQSGPPRNMTYINGTWVEVPPPKPKEVPRNLTYLNETWVEVPPPVRNESGPPRNMTYINGTWVEVLPPVPKEKFDPTPKDDKSCKSMSDCPEFRTELPNEVPPVKEEPGFFSSLWDAIAVWRAETKEDVTLEEKVVEQPKLAPAETFTKPGEEHPRTQERPGTGSGSTFENVCEKEGFFQDKADCSAECKQGDSCAGFTYAQGSLGAIKCYRCVPKGACAKFGGSFAFDDFKSCDATCKAPKECFGHQLGEEAKSALPKGYENKICYACKDVSGTDEEPGDEGGVTDGGGPSPCYAESSEAADCGGKCDADKLEVCEPVGGVPISGEKVKTCYRCVRLPNDGMSQNCDSLGGTIGRYNNVATFLVDSCATCPDNYDCIGPANAFLPTGKGLSCYQCVPRPPPVKTGGDVTEGGGVTEGGTIGGEPEGPTETGPFTGQTVCEKQGLMSDQSDCSSCKATEDCKPSSVGEKGKPSVTCYQCVPKPIKTDCSKWGQGYTGSKAVCEAACKAELGLFCWFEKSLTQEGGCYTCKKAGEVVGTNTDGCAKYGQGMNYKDCMNSCPQATSYCDGQPLTESIDEAKVRSAAKKKLGHDPNAQEMKDALDKAKADYKEQYNRCYTCKKRTVPTDGPGVTDGGTGKKVSCAQIKAKVPLFGTAGECQKACRPGVCKGANVDVKNPPVKLVCYACVPEEAPKETHTQIPQDFPTTVSPQPTGVTEQQCTCPEGSSTSQPDASQILASLNQYRCVSGASINVKGTRQGNCPPCYGQPQINVNSQPPVCKGTPCGDVPCDGSASCPCPDKPNCQLTVSCSWGGWKQVGQNAFAPVIGSG